MRIGSALMEKGEMTMADLEKIIERLRELHGSKETMKLISDTISLLKKQEAVTVHDPGAFCPKCGWMLYPEDHPKFCGNCGYPVKWE